jgi:cytochrome c
MKLIVTIMAAATLAWSQPGQDLFERRCSGCHSLDIHKEGPRLRDVYGRKSASAPGFDYSDALKKLNVTWDETTLNRWLTNPDAMAPNTDMSFRLIDEQERKAIIDYLKTLQTRDYSSAEGPYKAGTGTSFSRK